MCYTSEVPNAWSATQQQSAAYPGPGHGQIPYPPTSAVARMRPCAHNATGPPCDVHIRTSSSPCGPSNGPQLGTTAIHDLLYCNIIKKTLNLLQSIAFWKVLINIVRKLMFNTF